MRLIPLIVVCSSLWLLPGCGGTSLDAHAEPPSDAGSKEPAQEDIDRAIRSLQLGSSLEESMMEDATPSEFAMLTQGPPKAEETATPAPSRSVPVDPGLGSPGGRTLSGEQVQAGIRPHLPQVRACYEKELKKGVEFGGKVVVGWTIGADGKVRSPRIISDSTGNRAMRPCITRVVSRWQFKKAESPTDIEYPFRFKPSLGF
jgi:TonB family protein